MKTKLNYLMSQIELDYRKPDFSNHIFQEFAKCSKRIFVADMYELNSILAKAYKNRPCQKVYEGKEPVLVGSNYFLSFTNMDEDKSGRINRRIQSLLHTGIYKQTVYKSSKLELEGFLHRSHQYAPINLQYSITSMFCIYGACAVLSCLGLPTK